MEFDLNIEFKKMMIAHDLDTVVILGHISPDGDAAGTVMGAAHYLKTVYPEYKVIPYLADTMDKGPKRMTMEDKVFTPFIPPKVERYGVIVFDTASRQRMAGRDYYDRAEVSMVIDHHAGNEGYGDINNTRISEACAWNLYSMTDKKWLRKAAQEEYPNAADYIYLGILHDTGCFDRACPELFDAAADLTRMGVDHRKIMYTRKCMTLEDLSRKNYLLSCAKTAFGGKAAYVCMTYQESVKHAIVYEDIHPISETLRDCDGILMGFSMFEQEPGFWRCSFRSDGSVLNMNQLLQPLGGGGHAGAAGLMRKTDKPEEMLEEILNRIQEMTGMER